MASKKEGKNQRLRIVIGIIGLIIVLSVLFGNSDSSQTATNSEPAVVDIQEEVEEETITFKDKCDLVKNGMTFNEVTDILGEADTSSESEIDGIGTTQYLVFGNGFSMETCQVSITNDAVSMKSYTK